MQSVAALAAPAVYTGVGLSGATALQKQPLHFSDVRQVLAWVRFFWVPLLIDSPNICVPMMSPCTLKSQS